MNEMTNEQTWPLTQLDLDTSYLNDNEKTYGVNLTVPCCTNITFRVS